MKFAFKYLLFFVVVFFINHLKAQSLSTKWATYFGGDADEKVSGLTTDKDGNSPYLPMKPDSLSLYLQGWILQESYIAANCQRLERFYAYKKSQPSSITTDVKICDLMDEWFKVLDIDPKSKTASPYRLLAKKIAPYYKRPVLIQYPGVFKLGVIENGLQSCSVTDDQNNKHTFYIDPNFPVLIENDKVVKVRDIVQYAVLKQEDSNDPIIDHTAFFRWYTSNKMPRSIKTVEMAREAVEMAVKMKSQPLDESGMGSKASRMVKLWKESLN